MPFILQFYNLHITGYDHFILLNSWNLSLAEQIVLVTSTFIRCTYFIWTIYWVISPYMQCVRSSVCLCVFCVKRFHYSRRENVMSCNLFITSCSNDCNWTKQKTRLCRTTFTLHHVYDRLQYALIITQSRVHICVSVYVCHVLINIWIKLCDTYAHFVLCISKQ